MKTQVYKGENIKQTIEQVKRELGKDVVILNVSQVAEKQRFGFSKKILWEITAGVEQNEIESDSEFKIPENVKVKQIIDPKVWVFVGPTGAGKTSVIGKIASDFVYNKDKEASLVTLDTYKPGGYEQLKYYGDCIDSSVKAIFNKQDLDKEIQDCKGKKVVLVDTMGVGAHDEEGIERLKAVISADFAGRPGGRPLRMLSLVVSATISSKEIRNILKAYIRFNIDNIILTKVDEVENLDDVYKVLEEFDIPLSYISNGQNVPEDLISLK